MIETVENLADRHTISREEQDAYALRRVEEIQTAFSTARVAPRVPPCRPAAGARAASARPPGGRRPAPPGLVTAARGAEEDIEDDVVAYLRLKIDTLCDHGR